MQLAAEVSDEWLRETHLRARTIVLLEALVARYPDETEHRAAAYDEMGRHLMLLGDYRAAMGYAGGWSTAFPATSPRPCTA